LYNCLYFVRREELTNIANKIVKEAIPPFHIKIMETISMLMNPETVTDFFRKEIMAARMAKS
jgi:hypothetical protein